MSGIALKLFHNENYPKFLFPVISIIILTLISKLQTKKKSSYYQNSKLINKIRKTRKKKTNSKTSFILPKIMIICYIALLHEPNKTETEHIRKLQNDSKYFLDIEFLNYCKSMQTNFVQEQMTLIALSQIKIKNYNMFLKYLLLLSGDIESNPGPIQYPCLICQKPVRKRILYCKNCDFWIHKKCEQISKTEYEKFKITPQHDSQYICCSCQTCQHENDYTNHGSWDHLPFLLELPDDQLEETQLLNISSLSDNNNWEIFNERGLHFIHLNINSILSKIDELRLIAKNSKATIIGISESKIDETVLDGEICIEGYKLERSDRNRQGGGVVCYISKEISYNVREKFSSNIENIFLDILLPKTKPILIGILYRPPQSKLVFSTNLHQPSIIQMILKNKRFICLETSTLT